MMTTPGASVSLSLSRCYTVITLTTRATGALGSPIATGTAGLGGRGVLAGKSSAVDNIYFILILYKHYNKCFSKIEI